MEATALRDRPVFVATDGRRARRLRYGGAAAIAIGCLWLAGLAVGMIGFGHLPGLRLPALGRALERAAGASEPVRASASSAAQHAAASAASVSGTALVAARSRQAAAARVSTPQRKSGTRARAKAKTAPHQAATQPVNSPPTAASLRQGWARRGLTTQPGKVRQVQPKPAATPPGQTRRNGGTVDPTTPATPATAPPPPGQQKKADDPKQKG